MTLVAVDRQDAYLSAFERQEHELASIGPAWLRPIRRDAIECFADLGFPTARDEDWKFTSVAPLAKISFHRPTEFRLSASAAELVAQLPGGERRLIFVNGRYWPASADPIESGLIVTNLAEAFTHAESHLARYADYRKHAFAALNTAFFEDGAFVYVPAGMVVERPIHLVYVSLPGSGPQICDPRNLMVFGARSQASVIESYIGIEGAAHFTNAVTEIVAGEGAIVDHYKLQQEPGSAFHIATVRVQQDRGSTFKSHSFSFGGALTRNEVNAVLAKGSECTLNGLYVVSGRQHVDTQTSIDHAEPHAASHELYKGILSGRSSAVFNGKIVVRKDAQKTDAKQTNKNLVLSEDSTINTKPELQIHADDVRCTHGATIGQLDAEAIFYLRSRAIPLEAAREMLTQAFAREIVDTIKDEPLRNYVDGILRSRLEKEVQ
jgi:Fe-S cluster assembly protein SufD